MRGGFVPGDVAIATVKGRENVRVVAAWSRYDPQLRWCELSPRWAEGDDDECWYFPTDVADPRPLVVIDPEDEEGSVSRLWAILPDNLVSIDQLQAALRSLIADPKPEEPLGLGSVVEDADGVLWVRAGNRLNGLKDDWRCVTGERVGWWAKYAGIAAVRVLSGGVTE